MRDLRTIILAAGKGVRMKSQTPKVLHKVCGKPIIQYVLDVAKKTGSLKTYVVLGHQNKAVRESLDRKLSVVVQKKLLGTADAVKSARGPFKNYRGDVLILCGDTPLLSPQSIKNLIKRHRSSKANCTILTAVIDRPAGYGRIVRDAQGSVAAIREEKDANEWEKSIAEINTGVFCFKSTDLFKAVAQIKVNTRKKEFYLTDIVELFIKNGMRVETQQAQEAIEGFGINNRADLAFAESVIRRRILKEFMLQGVSIVDPNTTHIDADVKIGKDTVVHPFTVIRNNVRIGAQCVIGPFAHIRSGSRVGRKTEVGNFAELSRSEIGDDCFMKHFSFVGDAVVGSKVNIGAGVITANFDGKDKHRTAIKDGAFIGSDSILVAPIKIGKKAATGAGSVVTKDVPDSRTAVGIPAKVIARRKF